MLRHILITIFFLLVSGCKMPEGPAKDEPVNLDPGLDIHSCCEITVKKAKQCPRLRAYWDSAPNVRVCNSVDLTTRDVNSALDIWRNLGYRFGDVTTVRWELQECNVADIGDILIRFPSQREISEGVEAGHLAATKTYTFNPTGQIRGADIWYVDQSGLRTEHVLSHEIGHALGWMHCDERQHIMNSRSGDLGELISGVSFSEYLLGRSVIREVLRASP